MRLPFIQVDQDALVRARTMAGILKIPPAQGIGLAVSLFAWALEMASPDDLTGQIADDDPAEVVAAAVGWDGDAKKLYCALCRVGFIERSQKPEDGFDRAKGLDRYAEALALPSKRSEAGRLGAAKRWQAHGKAMASDGKGLTNDGHTQTHTQKQTHSSLPSEEKEAPAAAAQETGLGRIAEKPDRPADAWNGTDFFQWAQHIRQKSSLVPEKPSNPRQVGAWWASCLQTPGVTAEAMKRGFYAFGKDPYWEVKGFPFNGFLKTWERYVRTEVANAAHA